MMNVVTDAQDTFADAFRDAYVCISLDDSPFACFPVFHLNVMPRCLQVSDGQHTIVAMLTGIVYFHESPFA